MTREAILAAMRKLGGTDVKVLDILDVLYPPGWWNYICRVFNGGMVYSHLFAMEDERIVTSRWQEGENPLERGRRRRRLYSLAKPSEAA